MTKKNIKKLRRDYLSSISLQNFRGYFKETNINFGKKITLFFGKGSVGKSTALEAINCLAESNKADSDLQGIKTRHILSKKSSSKEFTLGLGVSTEDNVSRAIKKKFRPGNIPPKAKNEDVEIPPFLRRSYREGSLFHPHIIELYSSSEDPENKKNHHFVTISNSKIDKRIENDFNLKKFYSSKIEFVENEYAFKELWEATYKHTAKIIENLGKCKNFAIKYSELTTEQRDENKKPSPDKNKLDKIETELNEMFKLEDVEYTGAFYPYRFIFSSIRTIENHVTFLKKGKVPYKDFLNYIGSDIKKEKKFLYKNNRLYGRTELSRENIKIVIKKDKENIVQHFDTLSEFLTYCLTGIMCGPEHAIPSKDYFKWNEKENGKVLTTKEMFNSCSDLFKSTLEKIKTVRHIEKLQMLANMPGMSGLVEDGHTLIEENQKEINKWLALFDYDFKVSVERTGLSDETEIVHKKGGSKIPASQGGSGVEYLLTFLSACLNSSGDILLLEEPEKALHSKMQVNLAKFFVENSNSNQLIIETHSENLLLGILKYVRDGKISPEDIKINHIYMENGESKVDQLDINEEGSFKTKWRGGFFTEKLDLI